MKDPAPQRPAVRILAACVLTASVAAQPAADPNCGRALGNGTPAPGRSLTQGGFAPCSRRGRLLGIVHTSMYERVGPPAPPWRVVGTQFQAARCGARELARTRAPTRRRAIQATRPYRSLVDLVPLRRSGLVDAPLIGRAGLRSLRHIQPTPRRPPGSGQHHLGGRHRLPPTANGLQPAWATRTGARRTPTTPANEPVKTSPDQIVDPNRWQPLLKPERQIVQKFPGPHWAWSSRSRWPRPPSSGPVEPPLLPFGENVYRKEGERDPPHQRRAVRPGWKCGFATYWGGRAGHRDAAPATGTCFAQFVSERDGHTLDQDVEVCVLRAWATRSMDSSNRGCGCASGSTITFGRSPPIHDLYSRKPVRAWPGALPRHVSASPRDLQTYIGTPPFAE
jgi:hypothetical protein